MAWKTWFIDTMYLGQPATELNMDYKHVLISGMNAPFQVGELQNPLNSNYK